MTAYAGSALQRIVHTTSKLACLAILTLGVIACSDDDDDAGTGGGGGSAGSGGSGGLGGIQGNGGTGGGGTGGSSPTVLYSIGEGPLLVRFSADTPGTVTTVGITGLVQPLPTDPPLPIALDFRRSTGQLLLVTEEPDGGHRLYAVDPLTGTATQIGDGLSVADQGNDRAIAGFDVDPLLDQIRMITRGNGNYRVNPGTAVTTTDTKLFYPTGDTGFGSEPGLGGGLAGVGYLLNGGQTTAYALDSARDVLVTLGSVNGTPFSANSGRVQTIGSFGALLGGSGAFGFDVSSSGEAFMIETDGTLSYLYRVNLTTGAVTQVGRIGTATPFRLQGLAAQN